MEVGPPGLTAAEQGEELFVQASGQVPVRTAAT